MQTIRDFFRYLADITFHSWQEVFIKLLLLVVLVAFFLWLAHFILSKLRPANKQDYNRLRDVYLNVNLIWSFGLVFVIFSSFWIYVLNSNGPGALKYTEGSFWTGLTPVLTTYLLMIVLFITHFNKTRKLIKN